MPEEQPNSVSMEELKAQELKRLKRKRNRANRKNKWFDNKNNTYIYITGLPPDVAKEELAAYFKKCGIYKLDNRTGEEAIKIYADESGTPKGDARIGFAKIESVETAISMLDQSYFRPDFKIEV